MKTLKQKLLEAENRTKFWARGINITFPEAPDLEVFGSISGFRGTSPANEKEGRGVEFCTKKQGSDKRERHHLRQVR